MGGTATCTGRAWARLGNFQHILIAIFRATGSHKTDLQKTGSSTAVLAVKDMLHSARCEEEIKDKSRFGPLPLSGWVQAKLFSSLGGGFSDPP